GKAHEVPVDEEEFGQAGLLDHLQLALQTLGDRGSDRPIAVAHALEAELVEERERGLTGRDRVARKPDLAEVEVDIALLGDLPWRGERFGAAMKERSQVRAALEVMLRVGEEVSPRLLECRPVADRDQDIVE